MVTTKDAESQVDMEDVRIATETSIYQQEVDNDDIKNWNMKMFNAMWQIDIQKKML